MKPDWMLLFGKVEHVCDLQDLFSDPKARGRGVGRALIEHVHDQVRAAGLKRMYWQTAEDNPARKLYDQVAQLTAFRRYVKDF